MGTLTEREIRYGTLDVVRIVGGTFRKLDYWARSGVLVPVVEATGSGSLRRYTRHQVLVARVLVVASQLGARQFDLAALVRALDDESLFDGPVVLNATGRVSRLAERVEDGWLIDLAACRAYVSRPYKGLDS